MSTPPELTTQGGDSVQHPIQLRRITLRALEFTTNMLPEAITEETPPELSLDTAHSPHKPETNSFQVVLRCSNDSEYEPERDSYYIRVVMVGFFSVDTSVFPEGKIEAWAKENAPLILLPYLREQLYNLSMRAQIPPILLPLMQVPTVTIVNQTLDS